MNSRDFYQILYGWDAERYLTDGVKYCAIFIKNNQSLTDPLLVQYTNGTKRFVAGNWLFLSKEEAIAFINSEKEAAFNDINYSIKVLQNELELTTAKFNSITIEDEVIFN